MIHSVEVPVAVAELIDKITILEIKTERFRDATKLANAKAELTLLHERRAATVGTDPALSAIEARLKAVNERIWELEDTIRECERQQDFGPAFVKAARSIYRTNDERAALKREINMTTGSQLIEEKSYAAY
jgi:chromosome segregation ATPase